MKTLSKTAVFWTVLVALLVGAAGLALIAPEEATLGAAIRAVYVHVSLTWTGMLLLVVAALIGIGAAIMDNGRLQALTIRTAWVGFGFYTAGVAFSMISSKISWGAVFWQEPRMATALNMVAAGLIFIFAASWLSPSRWTGLLIAFYAGLLFFSTFQSELVLHPRNPIRSSSSSAIQLTFLGLTLIYTTTAVWILWYWQTKNRYADITD